MEIDLKLCNFAAEKASLLGACPQQGVGMKVKNKPWPSLNYTPVDSVYATHVFYKSQHITLLIIYSKILNKPYIIDPKPTKYPLR